MDEIRLIDANALKEKLLNSFGCVYGRRCGKTFAKEMIEKVFQIIDKTPTINPERPHGEWARHDEWVGGEYVGGFYHVNCPCIDLETAFYSKWRTNFCPNCGADMRPEKKLQTPSCLTNPERQAELLERYKEE